VTFGVLIYLGTVYAKFEGHYRSMFTVTGRRSLLKHSVCNLEFGFSGYSNNLENIWIITVFIWELVGELVSHCCAICIYTCGMWVSCGFYTICK